MIDDLERFLRLAAKLEADAADGYARLAEIMRPDGHHEVADMFAKFGEFSRLHLAEVRELQKDELDREFDPRVDEPEWPDAHSPENPLALAPLTDITPKGAIDMALETERRACDFYSAVAGQTRSDRVQELAQMFAEEEGEHVEHLQRWLGRLDSPQ
ncbi:MULTISPECIES: ferritin family protein [unclassified Wenzhouxiangella]|uniref:ferritin-like domain-containing protein n=1 Tax=unclassified Wenzhouxiangella TaxID=2613841 RepID=UPI000E32A1EE|nr:MULTISPECIES: ferritin family protein [unclassified Wenzhouxiangella]RFF27377.1 rubrerythrin [Wenzhouxiangella sp. 15181]RFP68805.1 rubrerythrin [Wenzhouxiangella sp. 15190]